MNLEEFKELERRYLAQRQPELPVTPWYREQASPELAAITPPTPEQLRSQELQSRLEQIRQQEGEDAAKQAEIAAGMEESGVIGDAYARMRLSFRSYDLEKDIALLASLGKTEEADRLAELADKQDQRRAEASKFDQSGFLGTMAEIIGPMIENFKDSQKVALPAAGVGAVTGIGAPVLYGKAVLVSGFEQWARQGQGAIYRELRRDKIDANVARQVSAVGGVIYGLVEQATRFLPEPIQKSFADPLRISVKRKLTESAVRMAAKRIVDASTESVEEGAQSTVQDLAKNFAIDMTEGLDEDGNPVARLTGDEVFQRALDSTVQAFLPSLALTAGTRGIQDIYNQKSFQNKIKPLEKELELDDAAAQEVFASVGERVSRGEYNINNRKVDDVGTAYLNELKTKLEDKRRGARTAAVEREEAESRREAELIQSTKQAYRSVLDDKTLSAEQVEEALNQATQNFVVQRDGEGAQIEAIEGQQPWQSETIYDEDDVRSDLRARAARDARAEMGRIIEEQVATLPPSEAVRNKARRDMRDTVAEQLVQDDRFAKYGVTKTDILAKEEAGTFDAIKDQALKSYREEILRSTERPARKQAQSRIQEINKELSAIRAQGVDAPPVKMAQDSLVKIVKEDGTEMWSSALTAQEAALQDARSRLVAKKRVDEERSRAAQIEAQAQLAEAEEKKSSILFTLRETTPWVSRAWLTNVFASGKDKSDLRALRDEANKVLGDNGYGKSEMELRRFAKEAYGWEPAISTSEARKHADRKIERPMLVERYKELAGDQADQSLIDAGLNKEIRQAIQKLEAEQKKRVKDAIQVGKTTKIPVGKGTGVGAQVGEGAQAGKQEQVFKTKEEAKKAAAIKPKKLTSKERATAVKARPKERSVLVRAMRGATRAEMRDINARALVLAQRVRTGTNAKEATPFAVFLSVLKSQGKSFSVEDVLFNVRSYGIPKAEESVVRALLDADVALPDSFLIKNDDGTYAAKQGPIVRVETITDPATGKKITEPFDPSEVADVPQDKDIEIAKAARKLDSIPWARNLFARVLERLGVIGVSREFSKAHVRHIVGKLDDEISALTGLALSRDARDGMEQRLSTIRLFKDKSPAEQFKKIVKDTLKSHAKSAKLDATKHRELLTTIQNSTGQITKDESFAIDAMSNASNASMMLMTLRRDVGLTEDSRLELLDEIAGQLSIDSSGNINSDKLEAYIEKFTSAYENTNEQLVLVGDSKLSQTKKDQKIEQLQKEFLQTIEEEINQYIVNVNKSSWLRGIYKSLPDDLDKQERIKRALKKYYEQARLYKGTEAFPVPNRRGEILINENFNVNAALNELMSKYKDNAVILAEANINAISRGKDDNRAYNMRRQSVMAYLVREVLRQLNPDSDIGSMYAKYTSKNSVEGKENIAKATEVAEAQIAANPALEKDKDSLIASELDDLVVNQIMEERSDWIAKVNEAASRRIKDDRQQELIDFLGAGATGEIVFTANMLSLANRLIGPVFSPVVGGRPIKGFFSRAALIRTGREVQAAPMWLPKLDEWTIEVAADEIKTSLYSKPVRDALTSVYGHVARVIAESQVSVKAATPQQATEQAPIIPAGLRAAINQDEKRYQELTKDIAETLVPLLKSISNNEIKLLKLQKQRESAARNNQIKALNKDIKITTERATQSILTIESLLNAKLVRRRSDKQLGQIIRTGEAYRQLNERVRLVEGGMANQKEYVVAGLRPLISAKTIKQLMKLREKEADAIQLPSLDGTAMVGLANRMKQERAIMLKIRDRIQEKVSEIGETLSEQNTIGYKDLMREIGLDEIGDENQRKAIEIGIQRAFYKAFRYEAPRITVTIGNKQASAEDAGMVELSEIEDKNADIAGENVEAIADRVDTALEALRSLEDGPTARASETWAEQREVITALIHDYAANENDGSLNAALAVIQSIIDYDNAKINGDITTLSAFARVVGEQYNIAKELYQEAIKQDIAATKVSQAFRKREKPVFIEGKEPAPVRPDQPFGVRRVTATEGIRSARVLETPQEVKAAMLDDAQRALNDAIAARDANAILEERQNFERIRAMTPEQAQKEYREKTPRDIPAAAIEREPIQGVSMAEMQSIDEAAQPKEKKTRRAAPELTNQDVELYRQDRLANLERSLLVAQRTNNQAQIDDINRRIEGVKTARVEALRADMALAQGRLFQIVSVSNDKPATANDVESFFVDTMQRIGGTFIRGGASSQDVGTARVGQVVIRVVYGQTEDPNRPGYVASGQMEALDDGSFRIVVSSTNGRLNTSAHELAHIMAKSMTKPQARMASSVLGYDIETVDGNERFVIELQTQEGRQRIASRILSSNPEAQSAFKKWVNRIWNFIFNRDLFPVNAKQSAQTLADGLRDFSLLWQYNKRVVAAAEQNANSDFPLMGREISALTRQERARDERQIVYQMVPSESISFKDFRAINFIKGNWSTETGKQFLKDYKARADKAQTIPEFYRTWNGGARVASQQQALKYARDVEQAHPKERALQEQGRSVWNKIGEGVRNLGQQTMMNFPNIVRYVSPKLADEIMPEYRDAHGKYRGLAVKANDMLLNRMKQEGDIMQRIRRADDITTDLNGTTASFTVSKATWYNIIRLAMNDEALNAMSNYMRIGSDGGTIVPKNKDKFKIALRAIAQEELNRDGDLAAMFEIENEITDMLFDEVNAAYKAITPESEWHDKDGLKKARYYAAIHRDVAPNVSGQRMGDITRLIRSIKSATEMRKGGTSGVVVGDGLSGLASTIDSSARFAGLAQWTTKVRDMMTDGWRDGDGVPNDLARTIINRTGQKTFKNMMEGLDQIEGKTYEENDAVANASRWFFRNWAAVRLTGPTTIAMQLSSLFIPSILYNQGITSRAMFNGSNKENEDIAKKYQVGIGGSIMARLAQEMPFDELNELGMDISGSRLAQVGRKTREVLFKPTKVLDQMTIRYAGRVARQWVEENMTGATQTQKEQEFLRRWEELMQFQMVGDPAMRTIYHNKGTLGKALNLFRTTVNAQGMKFAESYMKAKTSTDPEAHADFLRRGMSSAMMMMSYITGVRIARGVGGYLIYAALAGDDDDREKAKKEIKERYGVSKDALGMEATRIFFGELGSQFPGISLIGQFTNQLAELFTFNRREQLRFAAEGGAARGLPVDALYRSVSSVIDVYSQYAKFLEDMSSKYSQRDIDRIGVGVIDAPYLMLQDVPSYWSKEDRTRMRNLQRRIYKTTLSFVNTVPVLPLPVEIYSNFLSLDKALFNLE